MIYNRLGKLVGATGIIIIGETISYCINFSINKMANPGWKIIILMTGIGIFLIVLFKTWNWWMDRSRRNSWIESRTGSPTKALVAAVGLGNRKTAAEQAIEFHVSKLEHCWLLVSPQAEENFQRIHKKYGEKTKIYKREVSEPYNIEDTFTVMKGIYREAMDKGIKEQDIVCDYTGATASVSGAMILVAALSENRNLQYLVPNEIDENGRALESTNFTPLLIDFIMPNN